jgi:hypothetical protein
VKTFDLPHRFWLGTAALWLIAAILRWSVAPAFELLPTDYVGETSYTGKLWSRQTVLSAPEESESVVRRRDQTLTCRDGHAIIQGDAHWLTPAGVVIFETLNLYGVDRNNRQNLAVTATKTVQANICSRRILRRKNTDSGIQTTRVHVS